MASAAPNRPAAACPEAKSFKYREFREHHAANNVGIFSESASEWEDGIRFIVRPSGQRAIQGKADEYPARVGDKVVELITDIIGRWDAAGL